MKRNVLCIAAIIIPAVIMFSGCGNSSGFKNNAQNTKQNLKAAYKGETTASSKYYAYALKAKEEGYSRIATLFEAASKAEEVHAKNHKKVLEKLGETVEDFTPEFNVKTTKENLEDAIKGETYEFEEMYPGFIKTAVEEGVKDAKKSFTWLDTEKKHGNFYQNALTALIADNANSLPAEYYVCPVCGNTYNVGSEKEKCDFCGTRKEKFILIKSA